MSPFNRKIRNAKTTIGRKSMGEKFQGTSWQSVNEAHDGKGLKC